jgi:hypothetical protein
MPADSHALSLPSFSAVHGVHEAADHAQDSAELLNHWEYTSADLLNASDSQIQSWGGFSPLKGLPHSTSPVCGSMSPVKPMCSCRCEQHEEHHEQHMEHHEEHKPHVEHHEEHHEQHAEHHEEHHEEHVEHHDEDRDEHHVEHHY